MTKQARDFTAFDTREKFEQAYAKFRRGTCVAPVCAEARGRHWRCTCAEHADAYAFPFNRARREYRPEEVREMFGAQPDYNTITAPSGRLITVRD